MSATPCDETLATKSACLHLKVNIKKNFEMTPTVYAGARDQGRLIHGTNLRSKISCQTPFKWQNTMNRFVMYEYFCEKNGSSVSLPFCSLYIMLSYYFKLSFPFIALKDILPTLNKLYDILIVQGNVLYICSVMLPPQKQVLIIQVSIYWLYITKYTPCY